MKRHLFLWILIVLIGSGTALAYRAANFSFLSMWISPARQWQILVEDERYADAAKRTMDPLRQGTALYLDGSFKQAAAIFATIASPEGLYNLGNSYMLLGKYDPAIQAYEKALKTKPDWIQARQNLDLARLRKEKLAPPEDDYGGTGGMLEADEVVFGDRKPGPSSQETEENDDTAPISAKEQQALWLKKVQTRPADFLRLKFSYQLQEKSQ